MYKFTTVRANACRNNDAINKFRKIYLSLCSKGLLKGFYCVRGELETEQNCNILTPTLMAITAFLSRSPGLLNRGPGGPASLGHGPHSSIFSSTNLNYLSSGLYNNLTSTLPASVTISHSIQPHDSQDRPLISWYLRPDAPVIYTVAFLLLTAWLGSVCNNSKIPIVVDALTHRASFHFIRFASRSSLSSFFF